MIDYSVIDKMHAAARRERSEYVHCLIQRAKLWLLARLRWRDAGLRAAPCC
jgi:hypothetical protein